LLPSDPLTVTLVAFAAVTVNVEEPPAAIDAGLAVMLTVGLEGFPGSVLELVPPHPAKIARIGSNASAKNEGIL
jgi:hypothetical protein